MELLLSLLPGGWITALAGAVIAALASVFGIYRAGKKAGRDRERAKQGDAYERHLEEIRRASDARRRAGDVSLSDDPYNRDN